MYDEVEGVPAGGGRGVFSAQVWPVYIGAALEDSTPPFTVAEPHNGGYERGVIYWYAAGDSEIRGRGRLVLPPGVYSHFLFFHHPSRPQACGMTKMDFPLHCTEPLTIVDVDPIFNGEQQLAGQLNG